MKNFSRKQIENLWRPIAGLIFGIAVCLLLTSFAGENPVQILKILMKSSLGSAYDFGLTLFYTTSLIFTGLSVAVAFHAGLFNIGAEGQLTVATMAAAASGIVFKDLGLPWAPLLATAAALVVGGLWGFIPGLLKVWRGSHEVVVTMMMNFIAAGLTSYLVVAVFQNPESQNPETSPVGAAFLFKDYDPVAKILTESPANLSLLIALGMCVLLHFVLNKTRFGFELKATGQNETASSFAGISVAKIKILALTWAGIFAGLVATNEILGSAGKFRIGFSADYGFVGIAVALLARNHPLGIIASSLLFGILQKGTADLDIETNSITRDFSKIMQAVIILSVIAFSVLDFAKILSWFKNLKQPQRKKDS